MGSVRLQNTARMDEGADLYALPPEEFTTARDAAARQARRDGDRERAAQIAALRRPSVSAHAVNALVRAQPDLLSQLLDLGVELARAQSTGQGAALRQLGEQRRALVEAVADQAAAAAGRPLGAGPRAEVVATLEAALADPASAQAVRSGSLVRGLAYAGFGTVDLDGAVAAVPTLHEPQRRRARTPSRNAQQADQTDRAEQARLAAVAAAEQAALDAAGALDDAVSAHQRAAGQERAAVARSTAAQEALREAEDRLRAAQETVLAAQAAVSLAEQDASDADDERHQAVRAAAQAAQAVTAAQDAAERARTTLDGLRRPP